jgi:uncharacterized membrane protein YccC
MTSAYSFWANRSVRYSRTNRHFLHRYLRDNNRHSAATFDRRFCFALMLSTPRELARSTPGGKISARARH